MAKTTNLELWLILIFIVLILVLFIFATIKADEGGYNRGYREGQIDAIKGKINYELKENKAGETVWTEIKPMYELK